MSGAVNLFYGDDRLKQEWLDCHGVHETDRSMTNCVRTVKVSIPKHRCGDGFGHGSGCFSRGYWIDHRRTYVRDGQNVLFVSQPYGHRDDELLASMLRLSLSCCVYQPKDSWYYPGRTDLLVIVDPALLQRYIGDESRRGKVQGIDFNVVGNL